MTKIKTFILCCFLWMVTFVYAGDVNVVAYGAKGDGVTLNTKAIQNAIDACGQQGGGRVVVPKGDFLSGTVEFKNHVVLYLQKGARLLGSSRIEDYRNPDPFTEGLGIDVGWALLAAVDCHDIGIEGEGVIDGQGSKLKATQIMTDQRPEAKRWGRRPFLLRVVRCNGVCVKGITLQYAAAWTSHYARSRNVNIKGVKIVSVGVAHNDGIGIDGCQDVHISDCDVTSGDDALVFKTTSSKMACRNIVVSHMRLKSNQAGIKIGTESMADFENISIRDCYIYDTKNGGIKLLSVDGARIKNVRISGINMQQVRTPLLLRLGSRLSVFRKGRDQRQQTGSFENVMLKDIIAVSADSTQLKSATGILITGVPGHPVSGVMFKNIFIDLPGGGMADEAAAVVPEAIEKYPEVKTFGPVIPAYGLWARHVRDLKMESIRFRLRRNDARPVLVLEDATGVALRNFSVPYAKGPVTGIVRTSKQVKIEGWKVAGGASVFLNTDSISRWQLRLHANRLPVGQQTINL